MTRRPDWEDRLAAYLEPLRARPFSWGEHDCCTFGFGAVEAMTGEDRMAEFRGRYTTAIGSVRVLRREGHETLAAMLDSKFPPIPPALARRGDLIMTGGNVTVCWGGFAFAVGSDGTREGLIRVPRAEWIEPRAWRVGEG